MMVNPDKKKKEMTKTLMKWWVYDIDGNRSLRSDAPAEIVKLNEEYYKTYVH